MKTNNDLSKLIDNYLRKNKNKTVFFDNLKQLSGFQTQKIIDNFVKNLFKLSLKKKKKLVIGLYLDRNINYLISIFACWKAGATIIPLNKSWPDKHLENIRKQLDFDYIIKDCSKFNGSIFVNLKVLLKNNSDKISKKLITKSRKKNLIPYIIFTSGSTGIQKGVQITADGYLDYIEWTKENFKNYKKLSPLIITAEMTFDIAMGDIAYALSHKTGIVISSSSKNFFEHIHLIKKYKVEVFYSVPSTINLLMDYSKIKNDIKSIKLFISGGDVFNLNMIKKIILNNPKSSFYNVYGPTECTINVTSIRLDNLYKNGKLKKIPIGRIFKHLNYKLISFKKRKVIENKKSGELIISGNQVMKDYVNKESTKNEYFININNKKYYRTGDLVKKSNNILFLKGRIDDIVKIRGYRVNPQEVDNLILCNKKIINSKTIVAKKENKLITFIQISNSSLKKNVEMFIKKSLPIYMTPYKIIYLKKFTLGKSGKIDKNKLSKYYAN
jgi:acyl-coenzyme A synthetase/AMP-(fatty) acid ligase